MLAPARQPAARDAVGSEPVAHDAAVPRALPVVGAEDAPADVAVVYFVVDLQQRVPLARRGDGAPRGEQAQHRQDRAGAEAPHRHMAGAEASANDNVAAEGDKAGPPRRHSEHGLRGGKESYIY